MTAARILFIAANPSIDRLYELDRLTVGAIHRPELVVAVPGGKGLNAARAAARLGGRVTAVGIVGGRRRRLDPGGTRGPRHRRAMDRVGRRDADRASRSSTARPAP